MPNANILHVAPEDHIRLLCQDNPGYKTADLFREGVDYRMDVTKIDLDDNLFDVVICNHVLEHVPEDEKAMGEFYRILKPSGIAILMVPIIESNSDTYEDFSIISKNERELHFGQYDHVRRYGKDFFSRLENAGFEVETFQLPFKKQIEYGIGFGEKVIIGRK